MTCHLVLVHVLIEDVNILVLTTLNLCLHPVCKENYQTFNK